MKRNNKTLFLSLLVSCLFLSIFLLANQSLAGTGITDQMKNAIAGSQISLPSGGDDTAQAIAGKLIGAFLSLFGIIFMTLMIYGDYKWMLASGREEELTKAKDIIRAAIIGLAIVMTAYMITYFVVSRLQTATGL